MKRIEPSMPRLASQGQRGRLSRDKSDTQKEVVLVHVDWRFLKYSSITAAVLCTTNSMTSDVTL